MRRVKPKQPKIRIDGGRRRDLDKKRVARRMESLPSGAPTSSEAQARQKAMDKRAAAERKAAAIGHDGATISKVRIRLSGPRKTVQQMRCRPGTFEWRYGRNKQDALFHAGNHFAILWERAGVAVASSADFLRGTKSGYASGISDRRVVAIDALRGLVERVGQFSFERLMLYCVQGATSDEIAIREKQDKRTMGTVLANDLRQCAIHFKYLGTNHSRKHSVSETV